MMSRPQQLEFFYITDLLKHITRQNLTYDGSRFENVAEHSWHVALLALVLGEHAPKDVDLAHVVQLLIVHDLIEVYAGDTFIFSDEAASSVAQREQEAGKKLFGLLPDDQGETFWNLWQEFEDRTTPEARFAKAIDALHPVLMTWGKGAKGSEHQVTAKMTLEYKKPYFEDYPELWEMLEQALAEAVKIGILKAE